MHSETANTSSHAPGVTALNIDAIRIDGGTQPREEIDLDRVSDYADDMNRGSVFPPVVVFHDGKAHWLADGFHRFHAARKNKSEKIRADVRTGTKRDAVLHSVGANATHGMRRTNADKRRAVMTLLEDTEWGKWSDNAIAEKCGVSQPFVSKIRSSLKIVISEPRTYTTKHGTTATMNTSNIGGGKASGTATPAPPQQEGDDGDEWQEVDSSPAPAHPQEPTPSKVLASNTAMQCGRMAISQLERIPNDHPQRREAIALVADWIENS